MTRESNDSQQVVQYLLGRMSPQEQAAIEERYLTDPEFHDEVSATETDLIDQYVRGELAEAEEFERRLLLSPDQRERVEFARALLQPTPSAAAWTGRAIGHISIPERRLLGWTRRWQWAAAMVVFVAGGWLVVSRWPQPGANEPDGSRLAPGLGQPSSEPSTRPDSSAAATPSAGLDPRAPGQAQAPTAVRMATLVLTPAATRSGDSVPTLVLGGGETDVRLQLVLEGSFYTRYQLLLRNADRVEVWRGDRLTSAPLTSGSGVTVTLPAALFRSDDYTIRLSGVMADGSVEEAGGYYFRITMK